MGRRGGGTKRRDVGARWAAEYGVMIADVPRFRALPGHCHMQSVQCLAKFNIEFDIADSDKLEGRAGSGDRVKETEEFRVLYE